MIFTASSVTLDKYQFLNEVSKDGVAHPSHPSYPAIPARKTSRTTLEIVDAL